MMTKFTKGRKVDTLGDLVSVLENGIWVYWNHKPMHPSFLWNMQLRTLRNAITLGIIHVALRR